MLLNFYLAVSYQEEEQAPLLKSWELCLLHVALVTLKST